MNLNIHDTPQEQTTTVQTTILAYAVYIVDSGQ